jgi:hypothetical protein
MFTVEQERILHSFAVQATLAMERVKLTIRKEEKLTLSDSLEYW